MTNEIKKIGSYEIRVISAPMAGITDFVLRDIIRKYSKTCLLTTEMISSEALCQHPDCHIIKRRPEHSPISYQISGHKPELMAKSAKILNEYADIIDINMGCPVNKIIKSTDGCALMGNFELAEKIVKSVINSTDKPVTCKFRLGLNQNSINFVEFAQRMQDAGVSAVCIHARTRKQMYSGNADWKIVSQLKNKLDIPYFINGDINSPQTAREALTQSGADGIAIGRAILGNPKLPMQIEHNLQTDEFIPDLTFKEKITILKNHLDKEIELRGNIVGLKFVRKFYPYYIKGIRGAGEYRGQLVTEENYDKIIEILNLIT